MTTREAFAPDEWTTLLEGPPTAGMIVVMASSGGMFRETFAMSKAYAEARGAHGQSELLDEIVSSRPKTDHGKYSSREELRDDGLRRLRAAVAVLEAKATPDEVDGYRRFVLAVADKVAQAHREDDQTVSPGEAEALDQIARAVSADDA
jgi:hypothetical protein